MAEEVMQQAAQAADQTQVATEVVDGGQQAELHNDQTATETTEQQTTEQTQATPANKVDKRFSEITRAQKEAERRAQEAERRERVLLELIEQGKRPEPKETVTQAPQELVKPEPPQFETPDQYQRAMAEYTEQLADYKVKKALKEQGEQEQRQRIEQTQREYQERMSRQYADRRAAAMEKYADYQEVAERDDVIVSTPMAHAIANAEQGPDIAYHLGKNPKEAERIAGYVIQTPMGPVPDVARQMLELGMLAARLTATKPVTSKAPAPIAPIKGGAAPSSKSPDEMSMEEYAAQRSGRGR